MFCLLFGALTHAKKAECNGEYHPLDDSYRCSATCDAFCFTPIFHAVDWSLFLSEKRECPIQLYFTIDTSETIAMQEPPPGALVESIKVSLLLS